MARCLTRFRCFCGAGTGADDESCVGLENWLDKSGGCPICRTPWPPGSGDSKVAAPTPAPASAPAPNGLAVMMPAESKIRQLMAMGFERAQVIECLRAAMHDVRDFLLKMMDCVPKGDVLILKIMNLVLKMAFSLGGSGHTLRL